jgi:thiol-disulfide isomerase/thioredoxin
MLKNVCLLLIVFICGFLMKPAMAGGIVGQLAPNWILSDLSGTPISLYQEAEEGKTVVMFFWASWCKNCQSLMPVIRDLNEAKGDKPISIYLMNIWEDGDPVEFIKNHEVSVPLILHAENVARRYNINLTPGIVVVDHSRRIQYVRQSQENLNEVVSNLQKILDVKLESSITITQ